MGTQTTPEQREAFYALHQKGYTYAEIAEQQKASKVSKACVRYWCRRQRKNLCGRRTRSTRPARGLLSRFHPLVRYVILRLRLAHPRWGPNRIRHRLKKRASLYGKPLPSDAEIGRYLHQWDRFRRKPKKKPVHGRADPPTQVHQCWQIDFKMGIRLANGVQVNLFTVRDPVGEAYIGDFVYETRPHQRIHMEEVRGVLRRCFDRWGTLPDEVQTDGESVLVSSHHNDFPSPFTLWLVGLGIEHRVIKNVTHNAEVERCHRTVHDYAVVGNEDQTRAALQAELDQAVDELNYELSSRAVGCGGQPPVMAHPDLLQPRRPFQATQELLQFDLARVDRYLAAFTWIHRVNRNGQVSVGAKRTRYMVGTAYAGQEVEVRFDPQDRHFVFTPVGDPDKIIRRQAVKGLGLADLTGLEVWPQGVGPQQLLLPLSFKEGVSC